jgi:hypothetical protein
MTLRPLVCARAALLQTWGRVPAHGPGSSHAPPKRPPAGDQTCSSSSDSSSSTSPGRASPHACPYFLPPLTLPPHASHAPGTPTTPHPTRGHPNSPSSPCSRRGKGSEVGLWLESAEPSPCGTPSRGCGSSSLRQPLPFVPYPPTDHYRKHQHQQQRDPRHMHTSRTRQVSSPP